MTDPFESMTSPHPGSPRNALQITPNDNADLPVVPSCIWCNTPGDVRVTAHNGEIVTFKLNPSLSFGIVPIRAKRIHATGTTAAGIILLW